MALNTGTAIQDGTNDPAVDDDSNALADRIEDARHYSAWQGW